MMDFLVLVRLGIVIWSFLHIRFTEATRLPGIKITDIVPRSQSEIYVAWQPAFQIKRGKLTYVIRYKAKGSDHSRATTSKPEVTLKGLLPETTYIIAVRAVKRRVRGDWSKSVQATTKAKDLDVTHVDGNITIGEIGVDTAFIFWDLQITEDALQSIKGFRVVWKSKEEKEEAETPRFNITLPNLEPETRYSVNVYILKKLGGKIKLGAVKFQTLEEPIRAPRNLRIKFVTDKKIVVKWRHLRPTKDDNYFVNYILQYKRRGTDPPELCEMQVDNSTKSKAIYGVLPDAKYSVRVAGRFDNTTGPFTEWVRVRTEAFNQSRSNVKVYHISPEEVLLAWQPFLAESESLIDVFTDLETLSLSLVEQLNVNRSSHVVLERLLPDTSYRVIIKQTDFNNCPTYNVAEFKTNAVDSAEASYLESNAQDNNGLEQLDYRDYDPYLRLLPLPIGSHMVTWCPIIDYASNATYIYTIRILGEPFLYHLSTSVILDGRTYHVIEDLDVQKTYSIGLSVFDSRHEHAVFVSKHLLVLPARDVVHRDDVTSLTSLFGNTWPMTSMDIVMNKANLTDLQEDIFSDNISVQQILDTDWSLISKRYPDEIMDIDNVDNTTGIDIISFAQQVPPIVEPIEDIYVQEGVSIDVTCWSRGDPYPIMSWVNRTANESLIDTGSEVSTRRISVSQENYLGSGTHAGDRAFMGRKRFLIISPVALWDSGLYACVGENPSGRNVSVFSINVFPKPPRPVINLTSTSITPFDIRVVWQPPETGQEYITGYHVQLLDEYDVTLHEVNVTSLESMFSKVDPNTLYKILVSGYHQYAEGAAEVSVIKTAQIPILGPALDVRVKTFNETTLQVSWSPPLVVQMQQVRLRTFLFYHRKAGSRKAEEMQLHRNFTDISIISNTVGTRAFEKYLEPEEHYKVQVVAMSEDGQVSYSDWLNGSTYREAYMDESRPPPPPRNVFLRPEGDNVIVSWLPPFPDENILVRGYLIEVLHNGTKREAMEVDFKESSVIVYEVEMGVVYQISVRTQNKAGKSLDQWEEIYIPEEYVTQHPVQNFRGQALSSSTLELLWDAPESGAFTHFVLSYNIAGSHKPTLPAGGNLPSNIRNYIVRSLHPYTFYEFTITPFLKRMKGESSNVTVRTYSEKPANAPENVTLTPINATSVLITGAPPSTGKNGEVIKYKVSYRTKRTWRNDVIVDADKEEELTYYVTELLPSTVYEFRARMMTVNGSGPWSPWYQIRTPAPEPILPKVPKQLTTTATSTTITLHWQPPDQNSNYITGYIVGYGRFIPEVYRYSTTKDRSSYTLIDLESASVYIVSVRSFNDHGESVATFELAKTLEADADV